MAAALILFATVSAKAQTVQDMVKACQDIQVNGTTVQLASPDANQCWGYFSAVQQYATLVDSNQKRIWQHARAET